MYMYMEHIRGPLFYKAYPKPWQNPCELGFSTWSKLQSMAREKLRFQISILSGNLLAVPGRRESRVFKPPNYLEILLAEHGRTESPVSDLLKTRRFIC
jgi:hypothetical protein